MIETNPNNIKIPECCLNAAENPDEPCEHVLNSHKVKSPKINIGL